MSQRATTVVLPLVLLGVIVPTLWSLFLISTNPHTLVRGSCTPLYVVPWMEKKQWSKRSVTSRDFVFRYYFCTRTLRNPKCASFILLPRSASSLGRVVGETKRRVRLTRRVGRDWYRETGRTQGRDVHKDRWPAKRSGLRQNEWTQRHQEQVDDLQSFGLVVNELVIEWVVT